MACVKANSIMNDDHTLRLNEVVRWGPFKLESTSVVREQVGFRPVLSVSHVPIYINLRRRGGGGSRADEHPSSLLVTPDDE